MRLSKLDAPEQARDALRADAGDSEGAGNNLASI